MTNVEATLWGSVIGGVIGIVAAVVGYFLNRRTTIETARITEFNRAAAAFSSAFTEEIGKLQEVDIQNPLEFLGCGYVRHWNAVIQFLPYLSEADRPSLQGAWDSYKKAYHDHEFNSQGGGRDKVRSCADKALSHINTMLQFAVFK